MNIYQTLNEGSHLRFFITAKKHLLLLLLTLFGYTFLHAQTNARPVWWFGAAAGANLNFYRGSTQKLNNGLTVPATFHDGTGLGLYAAPLVEYRPNASWGIMLQAAYDGRSAKYDQILTPCNCPADLSAKLSYITIEPSFRYAPFKSGFYLYAGPRLAFNVAKSFTYEQHPNPAYPQQAANPAVKGDFSDVNKVLVSMQIGAGYDIALNAAEKRTQYVISPFISFKPYFGQSPRSIESWNVTTLTAGAAFKFGMNRQQSLPVAKDIRFSVSSPKNDPTVRSMRETFPLRNYIFFDLGSSEIPERYILLKKSEVKDFKQDQLEVSRSKKLSGRSKRQMVAYYNVLNILGDRMQKNPTTKITLSGSSEEGLQDGKAMAESVAKYLTDIFGIEPSRITTEGRVKPKNPSVHEGAKYELDLLREGDRRVTVESSSPVLLEEFVSGPVLQDEKNAAAQEAPKESDVSFNTEYDAAVFASWSLDLTDGQGKVQHFGPYTKSNVNIPGKTILGGHSEGGYDVLMTAQNKNGETVTKRDKIHVTQWTQPKNEEGTRYSVIFEFNEAKVTPSYEKYLAEIVAPQIQDGGTVIIHGYTDLIGDEAHNQKLSEERAADVSGILEKAVLKSGRKNVRFKVSASGEDDAQSPFENKFPEERFYNRTVVIDIIPKS